MSNYVNANEGKGKESLDKGTGGQVFHDLKDRVGATFQNHSAVNPASGTGKQGNPGKPI